jgi:Histidine phosphatase superfamily (branch 1)
MVTGGRLGSSGSGRRLLADDQLPLATNKHIVLVRHGQTTWNLQGRIQGSTNLAELTEQGERQVSYALQ